MKKKGYSLAEVIISIALLGIVIMSTLQIIPYGMKLNDKSEYLTVASNIGKGVLETASIMSIDQLNKLMGNMATGLCDYSYTYNPSNIANLKTNGCPIPPLDSTDNTVNHDFLKNNFKQLIIARKVINAGSSQVPAFAQISVVIEWKEVRTGRMMSHSVNFITYVTYNNIKF